MCRQDFYFFACPHCRHPLPRLRKRDLENTIAPAGIGFSGKTVFMTILIKHLLNKSIIRPDISVVSSFAEPEHLKKYREKHDLLYKHKQTLGSTQTGDIPLPYLLQTVTTDRRQEIPRKNKAFTLWYDFAGDSFEIESVVHPVIQYFRYVRGILFFVDPTNSERLVEELGLVPNDPTQGADEMRDEQVFTQIQKLLPELQQGQGYLRDKFIAVIVTKVDLFRDRKFSYFGEGSPVWWPSPHQTAGEFCLDDFISVNDEVKNYLHDYHSGIYGKLQSLDNEADPRKSNVGFFAVSPLGAAPEDQVLTKPIRPLRVEDPFYWMLWKMGHLQSTRDPLAGEHLPSFPTSNVHGAGESNGTPPGSSAQDDFFSDEGLLDE